VDIAFPLSTSPGVRPNEDMGRLVNAYLDEAVGQPPKPRFKRSPGLTRVAFVSEAHTRGLFVVDTTLLVIFDGEVYSVTVSGSTWTITSLGALSGADLVTVARNRAGTPNIVAVCTAGVFNLFTASAPTSFADADLPAGINSVSFLNGYFVFTRSNGEIWTTALNAVTVDALSFTQAQTRADGLTRGVAFRENFFAFGPASCEVYRDVGTSPFPLGFVTSIPRGIVGLAAVAGFEEGWANELIWVADDLIVYRLNGYEPQRISPPWVSRWIEALTQTERAGLQAFVTMAGGHAFWHLSCDDWSIVYDHTTGQWHEREAYGGGRWRASCSAKFNGSWVVGDATGGEVFTVAEDAYRDYDTLVRMRVQSMRTGNFPSRIGIPRADFDFTAGVGVSSGEAPDPVASISWSDDGGGTWSNPLLRAIGAEGEFGQRVTVLRTGMAGVHGRVWRVDVSDPVHVALNGGAMAVEGRSE
jgi:hypothetical protein